MGVNPENNKIEQLQPIEQQELEKKIGDLSGKLADYHSGLLRPDGSPVPKHWTILKQDELIEIKGYTFKIVYIGESNILLEPVKITTIINK